VRATPRLRRGALASLTCSASLLGLVSTAGASANASAAPCAAEVALVPEQAFVGQQVLYRVRILRREDVARVRWAQAPAFTNLRAEWLPGRAEDAQLTRDGATYHVREDHRALFPAWAGRLVLPSFSLLCTLESGEERSVEVAKVELEALDPPTLGRPSGFSGVIGPLHVQVSAEPAAIPLGDSVRVSVSVRGASNLWDIEAPFLAAERELGLEIHRERPELDLEAGTRLYVRRFFRVDVIPKRAGILTIPSFEIPHYDIEAGRYRIARSTPIEVSVSPQERPEAGSAAPDRSAATHTAARDEGGNPLARALLAALLVAATIFAARRLIRSRTRWQEVEDALDAAAQAREQREPLHEAAELARALRAALTVTRPQRLAGYREELDALQAELDGVRFAGTRTSPPRERVRILIRKLR
jgi:hypothetical protein